MNVELRDNAKCDIFTTIFQHMKLFSDNINIHFKSEGVSLQTMDSSHVSIIELNLPHGWFDHYSVTEDVVIGINTILLFKILGTREKGQKIRIDYESNNADRLQIRFESEESIFDKNFEVPLVDLDTDIMAIPDMEYEAEFTMPSAHFAGLVNQLKLFGDNMEIQCSESDIVLYSTSVDSGKMSVKIDIEDLNSFVIDEGGDMRLSYSLTHLYNMAQYHKLSSQVEISMKADFPLKMKLVIPGDTGAYIAMYLAPKIGDE